MPKMVIKTSSLTAKSFEKSDQLESLTGHLGPWQLYIFFTVSLVKLSSGWVQMSIIYLTPKPSFWCISSLNHTLLNNTCYQDCLQYAYDVSPFENTIVSEWDLVCDKAWLASMAQTVLQFGVLVGSILFGFMSDRYGRKNSFLCSIVLVILSGFAVPFAPDYWTFASLRFLLGLATAGTMVVSFVLVMETVGSRYRDIFCCLYQMPFAVGHVTLPLFAYYFRKWDEYSLALAIPPLIYLCYFFVLNESPRWLLSVGKVDEAAAIVKKAAVVNGLPTSSIEESMRKIYEELSSNSAKIKPNYWDLFRGQIWLRTVCCSIMWLVCGVAFFGLNQYISQTSSDPFIGVAAAALVQIPANLASMVMIRKYGRQLTTMSFFVLSGAFVTILNHTPQNFWSSMILGSSGVCCITAVAVCTYVFSTELFPTVVRNMGLGACSTAMRIGSMLAPFLSNMAVASPWTSTLVFGLLPILAGLICLLLPETKGRKLPNRIEDIGVYS